jgi:phenylacetate-CoA ligase
MKDRLFNVLKYAIEKIPYYKDLADKENIVISRENIIEDIKKFPIITKNIFKQEFEKFYILNDDSGWFYNYSGGSTGEPVKLIHDKGYDEHTSAVTKLHYEWADYYYGDTMVLLWGSQNEVLKEKEKLSHVVAEWIRSIYFLDCFSMDNTIMEKYIRFINRRKPKLILAYAQAINELSKYILKKNIRIYSPKAVMTSAGILYPEFRKNIEEVFKCPVFNRYGSREIGGAACECEKHNGLHISIFTHYLEILNDKLQPCKEGELGEIYVTSLVNYSMPLIRYKIGDMAIFTERTCSCGRGLPLIDSIVGRDTDVFKTRDGKIIDGIFFLHFIGIVHNNGAIRKFQLIQKDYDLIHIKVIINNHDLFVKAKKDIEGSFKKVMGENCNIVWNEVKEIKPLPSGKFRYTIREFE